MSKDAIDPEIFVRDKLLRGEPPMTIYAARNYGRGTRPWRVFVAYPGACEVGLTAEVAETAAARFGAQGHAALARKLSTAAKDVRELNGGAVAA